MSYITFLIGYADGSERGEKANLLTLVANLFLVAHGQNHCGLTVIAVESHIAAVPEVDDPLSILWLHILGWAADARLVHKYLHTFADRKTTELQKLLMSVMTISFKNGR